MGMLTLVLLILVGTDPTPDDAVYHPTGEHDETR
jgi:hypothetical protein